mgnify:FL=1
MTSDRGHDDHRGDRKHSDRYDDRKNTSSYKNTGDNFKQAESYKSQFEALNTKLDKILNVLTASSASQTLKKEVTKIALETVKPKVVEKKPSKKVVTSKKSKKK